MLALNTKASRGDVIVSPVTCSATYLRTGTVSTTEYVLSVVTSVTREGLVKGYRTMGDTFLYKGRPAHQLSVVSAKRLRDVATLEQAYVARGESHERAFKDLESAKVFIRPHTLKPTKKRTGEWDE